MNCDTCGTALTEFNATNYRHVHDVGNCAQVLLAQRDNARAALEAATILATTRYQAMQTLEADRQHLTSALRASTDKLASAERRIVALEKGREAGIREAAEVTREELATMRSWLMTWGPLGQPNWCDPKRLSVPVAKVSLERLLAALESDRALLRRIVEAVAEGYVLRQPDNGVHYCRSCSAKSPEWEHNSACRIELHKKAIREFHLLIDEARARIGGGK